MVLFGFLRENVKVSILHLINLLTNFATSKLTLKLTLMKKLTMMLLSALTALPMMAQLPIERPGLTVQGRELNIVSKTGQSYQRAVPRSSRIPASAISAGKANNTEKNLPEGEKIYYTIADDEIYENQESELELMQESMRATILVKHENDKVSLLCPFNILSARESNYMEGIIDGDKMKFNLPFILDEVPGYVLELSMLRFNKDEHTYLPVEDSENVLVMQISEGGKLSINTSDVDYNSVNIMDESTYPEVVLGVTAYDSYNGKRLWYDRGSWNMEFNPITLNSAPEELVFEEYTLCQENPELKYSVPGWNIVAGVAIDGNDIYIKGISMYSEDSIIKGTLENGVATFTGIQNAGFCPKLDYICYFLSTEASEKGDVIEIGFDAPLKMTLDTEKKTLKSKNVAMLCLSSVTPRTVMNVYFEPMCIPNTPENLNAAPEAPTYWLGNNWSTMGGGYLLLYSIPNVNINGCVLDKSKMYYNCYLNGEKYTFNHDLYIGLSEDLTDVPVDFDDGTYFIIDQNYGSEMYGIYYMCFNNQLYTTGIQTFYEGSDGVLYSSPLNEVNAGFYSGVKNLEGESAPAVSVEYFTLEGVKVAQPASGVYVKVSQLSDGTRKVEKIMQ